MKIEEMFPVEGKEISRVWLYPDPDGLSRGLFADSQSTIAIASGIYKGWELVVRTIVGNLHGLKFWTDKAMVKSGLNPIYQSRMLCSPLDREDCLRVIVLCGLSTNDLTKEEREEWREICNREEAKQEAQEKQRERDEKEKRHGEYLRLKKEFDPG